MRLFSRRAPLAAPLRRPTIDEVFRDDLGFIVGALLHFGIASIDVEDASHEVVRAVLMSLSSFDPSRDRRSWLFGVAFNVASNRLRRARRHRQRFVDDLTDVADASLTIEDQMIQSETHRTVREVLDGIDLDRRAVLIARIVHGWSELETAEALSIPIGTVKTRLRSGKQELRAGIERRERDEARGHRGAFLLPLGVLLADENRVPMVPTGMRTRLWEQLQDLIAQGHGDAPSDLGGSPRQLGVNASPLAPLRRLVAPEVGRAVVAAVAGGAFVFALGPIGAPAATTPTPEALATLCAAPVGNSVSAASSASSPTPLASIPDKPVRRAVRTAGTVGTSDPPELSSPATLAADPAAEVALMNSATLDFERNDTAAARRLLEQHAHDFPRSKLATSRELLWVRLLLREGRRAEAKAKADAIRKVSPNAPVLQTLDALFNSAEASP